MIPMMSAITCPVLLAARGVSLRPQRDADDDAMLALYMRHRWGEFAPLGMPEAQVHTMLRMQYDIQRKQYAANYRNPVFYVLEQGGVLLGRLIVAEGEGAVMILDVLLDANVRGQGIGGVLLAGVMDQAAGRGAAVSLHVNKSNPAQRLYERLGFRVTADVDIAYQMVWSAAGVDTPAPAPAQ